MDLAVQHDCINLLPIELILQYGFATRKPAITGHPEVIAQTVVCAADSTTKGITAWLRDAFQASGVRYVNATGDA
jgi:hypothetical protein